MHADDSCRPQPEAIAGDTYIRGGSVEDHLAIRQLAYAYAAALDNLDPVSMADCFASDGGVLILDGIEHDMQEFSSQLINNHRRAAFTMHTVANCLYDVEDATAKGITYGSAAWIVNNDGAYTKLEPFFRYHDELVKEDGRWRFLRRRFENIFVTDVSVAQFLLSEDAQRARESL